MYDDILVPTDGSEAVRATLEHALPIAACNDAQVHALAVVDRRLISAATGESRADLEESLRRDAEDAVAAVTDRADAADLASRGAVRTGTPSREILEYATEADVDLIAIGSHGRSPREKLQAMGSVSERVVESAACPVLVVRSG